MRRAKNTSPDGSCGVKSEPSTFLSPSYLVSSFPWLLPDGKPILTISTSSDLSGGNSSTGSRGPTRWWSWCPRVFPATRTLPSVRQSLDGPVCKQPLPGPEFQFAHWNVSRLSDTWLQPSWWPRRSTICSWTPRLRMENGSFRSFGLWILSRNRDKRESSTLFRWTCSLNRYLIQKHLFHIVLILGVQLPWWFRDALRLRLDQDPTGVHPSRRHCHLWILLHLLDWETT